MGQGWGATGAATAAARRHSRGLQWLTSEPRLVDEAEREHALEDHSTNTERATGPRPAAGAWTQEASGDASTKFGTLSESEAWQLPRAA